MQQRDIRLADGVIRGRSRANRLLNRVAKRLRALPGHPSDDVIIEVCTTETLQSCIALFFRHYCL